MFEMIPGILLPLMMIVCIAFGYIACMRSVVAREQADEEGRKLRRQEEGEKLLRQKEEEEKLSK